MPNDPVQRVLVVGTSRPVGAAIARRWSERYDVVSQPSCSAANCQDVVASAAADVVLYCGPASESSWSTSSASGLNEEAVCDAARWAAAAGPRFVAISSDAVFTGPYMFHDEQVEDFCSTSEAAVIQAIEMAIIDANPSALIVRTHAIAPAVQEQGLIEQILNGETVTIGGGGHATPILASDLADLIERAIVDDASGILHIAGAERVSPHAFAERLREAFDLPRRAITVLIGEHESGFASGDRSLVCTNARRELGLSMPLLTECFARLREELEAPACDIKAAA